MHRRRRRRWNMAFTDDGDGATPNLNRGMGFLPAASSSTSMPRSRESSVETPHAVNAEFQHQQQQQDSSDALAFAKRILLASSSSRDDIHAPPRSRTVSSTSVEYAYQQDTPEAGPSSPPPRSASASSAGPPQLPPRRRISRGTSSISSRQSSVLTDTSGHRHASSTASAEKQALAKLVEMYESLVGSHSTRLVFYIAIPFLHFPCYLSKLPDERNDNRAVETVGA